MLFDAGVFFALLGLAILFFFLKVPYREIFMFLSCAIFLILGFMLFSDYDVTFTIQESETIHSDKIYEELSSVDNPITLNSTETITKSKNQTYYVFGDETSNYNIPSKYVGVFLMLTSVITGMISFIMLTNTEPQKFS